jgi:hypothetical protein
MDVVDPTRVLRRLTLLTLATSVILASQIIISAVADAHPAINCDSQNAYYKSTVEATQDTQRGNHQGVKSASMWVGASSNDCSRISSLGVTTASGGGLVEWGWNLGWLWDTAIGGSCDASSYQSTPTRFIVWRPRGGASHCHTEGSLAESVYRGFTIKDSDSDTVWSYDFEGDQYGTVNVDFDRGLLFTMGERHDTTDSAQANFDVLSFQVAGSTTWYAFSDIVQRADSDPSQGSTNFNCIKAASNNMKVKSDPRTCP